MKKLIVIRQISVKKLLLLPNNVAIVLITLYQYSFSPTKGILRFLPFYPKPSCAFYPSCSEYAKIVFHKNSFLGALQKTGSRILRCNHCTTPSIDIP